MESTRYRDESLCFGFVSEVDGQCIKITADRLECPVEDTNEAPLVVIGALILLASPSTQLIAMVSGIRVVNTGQEPETGAIEKKTVTCHLVGFLEDGVRFRRGINSYPTYRTNAYLLRGKSLHSMMVTPQESIPIGERFQQGGGQEYVKVDGLFGRHTAVLGTT